VVIFALSAILNWNESVGAAFAVNPGVPIKFERLELC
jgi:hypothetical protein